MLRLIDRPGAWQPSGPIVRAEEYQALLDAEGLVADARAEAERLRAEARAEYQRQKEQGRAEGLRQAREESAEQLVFAAAETLRGFRAAEAKLVAIVEKTVRKVVGELDARERIAGLVRTALAGLAAEGKAKVRVAADDLAAVRQALAAGNVGKAAEDFVDVAPDPRLAPGSCVIATDAGVIDASLETQLAAIGRALRHAAGVEDEAPAEAAP